MPRWQSISIQANIVRPSVNKSHLRDTPRDTHGAIADYDDTALGTGTLTVHPWRPGPDCGKLLLLLISRVLQILSSHYSQI